MTAMVNGSTSDSPIVIPLFSVLFLGAALALFAPGAFAQRDMGCSPTVANPCSGGGGGSRSSGGWGRSSGVERISPAEQARQQRRAEAVAANDLGVEYAKKGEWDRALALYQEAADKDPEDPVIRQNLANAQQRQANARREQEAQQQARASAGRMNQSIQEFAQSLNAAPVSGGLDFDGRNAGTTPGGGNSGGLDFASAVPSAPPSSPPSKPPLSSGDPRIVDARNVPSGLPKDMENAIAGRYSNAPPGVSDRVRKGFQAVMDRDWNVAKAWFQDALNRDPGNADLKRLVAVAGSTPARGTRAVPSSAASAARRDAPRSPAPDDVYYYVPSRGYDRMTRDEAQMRVLLDGMMGVPPGSIVNIR